MKVKYYYCTIFKVMIIGVVADIVVSVSNRKKRTISMTVVVAVFDVHLLNFMTGFQDQNFQPKTYIGCNHVHKTKS